MQGDLETMYPFYNLIFPCLCLTLQGKGEESEGEPEKERERETGEVKVNLLSQSYHLKRNNNLTDRSDYVVCDRYFIRRLNFCNITDNI